MEQTGRKWLSRWGLAFVFMFIGGAAVTALGAKLAFEKLYVRDSASFTGLVMSSHDLGSDPLSEDDAQDAINEVTGYSEPVEPADDAPEPPPVQLATTSFALPVFVTVPATWWMKVDREEVVHVLPRATDSDSEGEGDSGSATRFELYMVEADGDADLTTAIDDIAGSVGSLDGKATITDPVDETWIGQPAKYIDMVLSKDLTLKDGPLAGYSLESGLHLQAHVVLLEQGILYGVAAAPDSEWESAGPVLGPVIGSVALQPEPED